MHERWGATANIAPPDPLAGLLPSADIHTAVQQVHLTAFSSYTFAYEATRSQARRGVVDVTSYTVTATRDGNWWSLIATDVDGREVASQSRRLDQADAAIREAIALVLDVDVDSFDVDVVPTLDQAGVSDETIELLDLRRELARLGERSRRLTPQAVAELRAAGLTVRDVAELLGVTPSRVSQIEHQDPRTRSAS